MSPEKIKTRYLEIQSKTNFFTLPDYEFPLASLIGYTNGEPSLLIITRTNPPQLKSSVAVVVEHEIKESGQHYLFLTLHDNRFRELFFSLCADLLAVMNQTKTESEALAAFVARYEAWQEFWRKRRGTLSEEQVRGLAGELLYLESCLDKGMSELEVLRAWHGAEGADQDFVFNNGWAEIKTVRQSVNEVTISSLEQLDSPLGANDLHKVFGHLVVYRLHDDPTQFDSFSLSELSFRIQKKLARNHYAKQLFDTSLMLVGADIKLGERETSLRLRLIEKKCYDALAEDFPKLKRGAGMPEAVTAVKYKISLASLEPWNLKEGI